MRHDISRCVTSRILMLTFIGMMMKDLNEGALLKQMVAMAVPIGIGMLVQTLYLLVDLYFVGQAGNAALAAVSAASNASFIVMALTQMLSVGTVALMAPAVGARDRAAANLVFNQCLMLAALCFVLTLAGGYLLAPVYLRVMGASADVAGLGLDFLHAFLPGLALQFALAAMGSALRATGIVKPVMLIQMLSVLVNLLLAPLLIAGWGTGHPLGVTGAGLASTLATVAATVLAALYFVRSEHYVGMDLSLMRPRWNVLARLLGIGFPAGAEFACLFVFVGVVYASISQFGAAAMAGFGVGARIMQAIFLPGMAIAFALPAIAGQAVGAGAWPRVRDAMRLGIALECGVMLVLMVVCKLLPDAVLGWFTDDLRSAAYAREYLQIISWNFVATGIVYACSGMFQALGNTWPGLLSTAVRLLVFAGPALYLARQPGFRLTQLWYLAAATVVLQALLSLSLLRRLWRSRVAAVHLDRTALTPAPAMAK